MQKIIYPYVRFSTEIQNYGSSYRRQIKSITEYAEKNGYTVNNSLNLKDLGLSAYRPMRVGQKAKNVEKGALGVFLACIENGKIESDGSAYLCIEQLDRLSREEIDDAYEIFRKILKSNVNIITLMDNRIYTKDSLKDLMTIIYSLMLMSQANLESAKKSERILAAFEAKTEKLKNGENIQFSGMIPHWIKNEGTRQNKKFVVIKEKAEILKRIFKMYINNTSLNDIARILNKEKIKLITRNNYKLSVNVWSSGKINHILKNRCLLGEFKIKKTGEVFENYYPQVISQEDFDIVQAMRKNKKKIKLSGRKSINIFQSKMFCVSCGQKYYFETDDKTLKEGKKFYYMLKCSGRRSKGCKSFSIRYEDFINSTPNLFGMISKEKKDNSKDIKLIKEKISEILKDTKILKKQINTLEEMNDSNEIDFDIYLKESSKIQRKIRVNDNRVESFRLNISRLSSDNKLDFFDLNDQVSVEKAKRYINENFSAFIISKCSNYCRALYRNGSIIDFVIKGSKVKRKNEKVAQECIFKSSLEFTNFLEEIKELHKKDLIDNSFLDILKSISYWGIETPEKDFSID